MTLADRLKKATGIAAIPVATVLTATVLPLTAAHAQATTPAAFLKVITPQQNETLGANKFNLDVQFKSLTNAPIVTAELWVDGVRWVRRDLDSPRKSSTLSFLVDGSSLSAGSHAILVKVFNANGDSSLAKVSIVAGSDQDNGETAWGGPEVQFVTPGNGRKVTGNVELVVDAKSRNGQNPYVTFYVDKKFKTLKNYPPYTFVWDTTLESNGPHEIVASGYLDSSNVATTRRINVFVNNPGGNTVRKSEIPDLAAPKTTTTAKAVTPALTIPLPKKMEAMIPAPTGEPRVSSSAASLSAAGSLGLTNTQVEGAVATAIAPKLATPKLPTFQAATVKTAVAATPKVAATAVPTVTSEPTLSAASEAVSLNTDAVARLADVTFAAPKTSLAAPRLARPATPVVKTVISSPMRTVLIIPGAKKNVSLAAPTKIAPVKTVAKVSVAAPQVAHRVTMAVKPLQVAFDGTRIAFDVQPRVEAGMPIAPFRQIFEHTGGRVSWAKDTQTVHAVNADREIVIGVGKSSAKVNGTSIKMDRPASLERGRTVVPLNFVGKALDVNVKYDPATGHLTITSKN